MRSWILAVLFVCAGCGDDAKPTTPPSCEEAYSHYYGLAPSCAFRNNLSGVPIPLSEAVETCEIEALDVASLDANLFTACAEKFDAYLRCVADLDRCEMPACLEERLAVLDCGP
jgi:hypothetical protein